MDAEEQGGTGAVGDPGAGDVADARALGAGARHHDAHARPLEQCPHAKRDREIELRLRRTRDDAARAAAVLDLPGRRARPDRLGLEICPEIVAGIDDDDRAGGSGGRRRGREDRDGGEQEAHAPKCAGKRVGGRGYFRTITRLVATGVHPSLSTRTTRTLAGLADSGLAFGDVVDAAPRDGPPAEALPQIDLDEDGGVRRARGDREADACSGRANPDAPDADDQSTRLAGTGSRGGAIVARRLDGDRRLPRSVRCRRTQLRSSVNAAPFTLRWIETGCAGSAVRPSNSTFVPTATAAVGSGPSVTRRTSISPTMLGWIVQ